MGVPVSQIRIAKVIGENEEGMTLFVPKDEHGSFQLEEGDRFLSIIFVKNTGTPGEMETWVPWRDGDEST